MRISHLVIILYLCRSDQAQASRGFYLRLGSCTLLLPAVERVERRMLVAA